MQKRLTAAMLMMLFAGFLGAATFETKGTITNLFWPTDGAAAAATFTAAPVFWQLQGSVSDSLSENLRFKGGIEQDPVLKRRLYAELGFDLENLTVVFTPFIGVLNSTERWFNPGLEASVRYTLAGLGFLSGGFSTTFAPLSKTGDYYVSSEYAALGLYIPNGIITLSAGDKAAIARRAAGLDVADRQVNFGLDTEMFVKNFPLRPAILMGYQVTERSYAGESLGVTEYTNPVNSLLLGLRLTLDVGTRLAVFAEGNASLFSWGSLDTTLAVPDSSMVYQAATGIRITY